MHHCRLTGLCSLAVQGKSKYYGVQQVCVMFSRRNEGIALSKEEDRAQRLCRLCGFFLLVTVSVSSLVGFTAGAPVAAARAAVATDMTISNPLEAEGVKLISFGSPLIAKSDSFLPYSVVLVNTTGRYIWGFTASAALELGPRPMSDNGYYVKSRTAARLFTHRIRNQIGKAAVLLRVRASRRAQVH